MRLEAQAKAGFYPTPLKVVEIIQTWIGEKNTGLRRLLDPVAAPESRQPE